MNNLGLFFQFGIRMQGGPAFIKRTREAVGQLQTRTRTCTTNKQFVVHESYCSNNDATTGPPVTCDPAPYSNRIYCDYDGFSVYGVCPNWFCDRFSCVWSTSCSAYGAWSNVSSCTPSTTRQCQTIYSFRDEDWSAYEEVDVCTPQSPTPAAGAIEIECVPQ